MQQPPSSGQERVAHRHDGGVNGLAQYGQPQPTVSVLCGDTAGGACGVSHLHVAAPPSGLGAARLDVLLETLEISLDASFDQVRCVGDFLR